MNMMVNTSELVASGAETNKIALKKAVAKLVASWEKKQATRVKKIGGFGLLAVSLAACNSSSDDTAATTPSTPATPAAPAEPTTNAITVEAATTSVFGTSDNDVIGATSTTLTNAHIIADSNTSDADVLNIVTTGDYGGGGGNTVAPTVVGVETVNFILESVSASGTNTDAVFEAGASAMAAGTFTMDVNKVGSPITEGSITLLATGSVVTFSDDFSTQATVDGDDNAALTVTASADRINANSAAGSTTTINMTGTDSAAAADTRFDTDSDAAATFTTTGSDMTLNAITATTIVATSAGDIDANDDGGGGGAAGNGLDAATSVTLTSAHEMDIVLAAAATATLSAGGTTASNVDDSAANTLTSVTLSGNGSAHSFNLTDAEGLATVTLTGSQNVTAIMDAADLDALTSNKITVVDNTADAASANITTTLSLLGSAGDVDATSAAVDVVNLDTDNSAKTLTVASGASVKIARDQTGTTTIDGPDAGASSNSVTISMDDGNVALNDTPDVTGGLTLTDFKTATIDASVESTTVAGATLDMTTLTAIDGSSDNTNLTINAGSNLITLAGTHTVGTGSFTISSNAAVALGASDITATAFTHTGTGAVTWTDLNSGEVKTVTTGSGADAITVAATGENLTLSTGAGADTITWGASATAAKTYTIDGGAGADILSISTDALNLNAGTAFTMSNVETINLENGVVALTVGNALVSGKGIIIDHATEGDTFDITVAMGTATSTDLSTLTINGTRITTADEIVISNGAATAALTLTGADGIMNDFDTGSGGDTLTGGTLNDDLDGAGGDDIISGGAGNDILVGGAGADVITGGAGTDNITGDAGADTLTGGAGADTYVYDTGDAASGESIVETSTDTGTDVVSVNTTTDFSAVTAASFDNIEEVSLASGQTATFTGAQVTGETIALRSAGTDGVVVNSAFGETVTLANFTFAAWNSGTDTITFNGTGGGETFTGTTAVDTVVAGAGNDTITGGDGADIINVGTGTDTVVILDSGSGTDVITGFGAGANGDVIRLDLSGMEEDAGGVADGNLIELSDSAVAAGEISTSDTVVLTTITAGALDLAALAANTTILALNGNLANDAAVVAALDNGGSFALTADGEVTAKDMFLVLYDDNTHTYLSHCEVTTTSNNDTTFADGTITSTTIAKFDSVNNVTSFHADNFSFIA